MPDKVSAHSSADPAKREAAERPIDGNDGSGEIGQLRASVRELAPLLKFEDEPAQFRALLERRAK